jgi:hypothetical protein
MGAHLTVVQEYYPRQCRGIGTLSDNKKKV